MRHRVAGKKLNRDTKARKALFKNLITSLILYERIKTTEVKAKAIKGLVDKLVTKAKSNTLAARRMLAAFLPDKNAVDKMMEVVGPRFKERTSGFTRTIHLGPRKGDAAEIVQIEFVEGIVVEKKQEEKLEKKETKKVVKKEKNGKKVSKE